MKTISTSLLTCLSFACIVGQGLHLEQGTNHSSDQTGGFLWIGNKSGQHISIDQNDIQARFDFSENTLFLNPRGGDISMLQSGNIFADLTIDGNGLFYDNSTDRVGIGTYSPTHKLEVFGDTKMQSLWLTGSTASDNGFILSVEEPSSDIIIRVNDNVRIDLDEDNDESGAFEIFNGANAEVFTVNESGVAFLHNKARVQAHDFNTYSDRRIKTNFKQMANATETIMQLKPLKYDQYNSQIINGELKIMKSKARKEVGFVAQDMYNILPELVTKPNNENEDLWSINYIKLIPYLTRAVQEQQTLIEAQFLIIEELQTEMKKLVKTNY